jgi:type II secretory pathway component PulM
MRIRRRFQRGYLFEVPIVLMLLLAGIAIAMPRLPPTGKKLLAAVSAVPVLVLLYVLIAAPGWRPAGSGGRRGYARLAGFLLAAAAVVAAVLLVMSR